jgi:hypothetical protein
MTSPPPFCTLCALMLAQTHRCCWAPVLRSHFRNPTADRSSGWAGGRGTPALPIALNASFVAPCGFGAPPLPDRTCACWRSHSVAVRKSWVEQGVCISSPPHTSSILLSTFQPACAFRATCGRVAARLFRPAARAVKDACCASSSPRGCLLCVRL